MEKPIELDHQLLWLSPSEAVRKLKFPSQSWAIARSLNIPHVACALIIQDKKLLLGKRSPNESICPNQWDLFGGHLEPNESPTQALIRELLEEIDIHPEEFQELRTMLEYNPHLGGPVIMHLYTVNRWTGNIEMRGNEHSEIQWFPIAQACLLQNLAHPGYREIFDQFAGPKTTFV
jgi:8-oxo-dGTP diphosphatase